ncbi:MAG: hypothetical protein Crog4KO_35490 [Crocinitomicaceae bacterium]
MIDIQVHHRRWRTVVMPTEHGSWGFILEPILLGLLLAPGFSSLMLSIAFFTTFLLRQPLKLFWKDKQAGRHVPRTNSAIYFMILFASTMFVAGMLSLLWMSSLLFLAPIALALPLFAVQFHYDLQSKSRNLLAELCGVLATGAFATSLVLIEGWAWQLAFGLWLALAVKGVTAVLYIRARLHLERGIPINQWLVWLSHLVAILLIALAVIANTLPTTAFFAVGLLALRAGIGFSSLRRARQAKAIGILEMIYGFSFVLLLIYGYYLNLFI